MSPRHEVIRVYNKSRFNIVSLKRFSGNPVDTSRQIQIWKTRACKPETVKPKKNPLHVNFPDIQMAPRQPLSSIEGSGSHSTKWICSVLTLDTAVCWRVQEDGRRERGECFWLCCKSFTVLTSLAKIALLYIRFVFFCACSSSPAKVHIRMSLVSRGSFPATPQFFEVPYNQSFVFKCRWPFQGRRET